MKYRQLGQADLRVSVISFGTFGLGGGGTWSDTKTDDNTVASLLDAAEDVGINLIDSAPVYGLGTSETMLGEALKGRRDKFIVQTKCALNWRDTQGQLEYVRDGKSVYRNLTAKAVRQDLEDSLLRMKTDYIDVYITHRQSEGTPVEQTMGELLKLKAEGKIRAIGISNASPEILSDYLRLGHVALVQEKFSMLTRGAKVAYIPACERAGTAFQAFASLEAGALSSKEQLGRAFPQGDYRARNKWFTQELRPEMERFYAALEPLCEQYGCSFANLVQAWTLAQSDCMNLLTGIRRVSSLLDSAKAADIEIKAEDLAAIDAACDALQTH